ncbi:AAA family ATPase [Anaerobacillus arseniciselenatis]|nr:AAA family ATPase [Anaerobacillus arseniciselenatis]
MAHREKSQRGEIIAVCSAKGGVGRTVLTVNLAIALRKKNIQISVVDGDFQFGDIGLALDIQSTLSIKDIVEEADSLDQYSLVNFLNKHESGIKVLSAPDRPEYADLINEPIIDKVLDLLALEHDYVLADTGVGLQEKNLPFIEKADQILLVTTLEMATLKNTKLMLETLETLGLEDKVQIVINRSTMTSVINAGDVSGILGIESPYYIPNDFNVASQSLNIGIPFVINQGKTDISKAYFKMAEQLTSRREIMVFKQKEPSIWSKLFQQSKRIKEGG